MLQPNNILTIFHMGMGAKGEREGGRIFAHLWMFRENQLEKNETYRILTPKYLKHNS
jgi:hypothetical protein